MEQDKPTRPVPAKIAVEDEEAADRSSTSAAQHQTPHNTGGHRGQSSYSSVDQKSPSMTPNGPMDNLKTPPTIARNRATPRSGGTPPKLENLPMAAGMAARTPRTLREVTAGPLSARTAWTSQLSARSAPRSARLLLSSRSYRGGMSYRLMQGQDEAGTALPRTHGLDTQAAARQAARKIADLLAAQAKQRRLEQQLAMQVQEDPASEEECGIQTEEVAVSDQSSEAEEGLVVEREPDVSEEAAASTRKDPLTKAEVKGFFNQSASGSDTPSAKAASVIAYFDSTAPVVPTKKQLPPTPRGTHHMSTGSDADSCIVFGADINGFRPASLAEYRREARGQYSVMKLVDESTITRHKGPRRAFIPDVRPFIPECHPSATPRDSFLSRLFNFGSSKQPCPTQPKQPFSDLPAQQLPSAVVPGAVCF